MWNATAAAASDAANLLHQLFSLFGSHETRTHGIHSHLVLPSAQTHTHTHKLLLHNSILANNKSDRTCAATAAVKADNRSKRTSKREREKVCCCCCFAISSISPVGEIDVTPQLLVIAKKSTREKKLLHLKILRKLLGKTQ